MVCQIFSKAIFRESWLSNFEGDSKWVLLGSRQLALEIVINNWNPMGNLETSSCAWIYKLAGVNHRTRILQFRVFFVALSPLVFVSHNPPLWESGAWLTGLQNQIQGPPLLRPCLHKIPIVRLQRQFFWQYKFLGKKDPHWPFFGLSDKANAKVKVLRFWWEFPNWMFWELCHFPDPAPVTSD